ncbi:MAG: 1-acyl-sn-glycerol-3-phosphate acyltransferase [Lachnospiraceae bacterium]|nr:1-acyl-sn-glycerol-3-phosphate acyltransferase [Lachnospiraceae bacterium]
MWVIRLVLTVIVLVLLLLIGLVMHVITWIVGRFDQAACLRMRSGYMRLALKLLWVFGGGKATVIGTENIPTDRAVLFVGNHRSIMDVVLAGHLIPVPVGFISKIELKKIPLLNLMMEDINCLFLDRKDDRQALKLILKAIELIKGGQSMFVFPEGTRSKVEGELLPFHAGSFKIATKPKVPVVPVTITGMGDVLEDHFPKLKRVPVVIELAPPIETATMSRDEIRELPDRVRDLIAETYERNRKLI